MKKMTPDHFRNLIFGAEDSLVSTLGLLFGITSVAGFTRQQIFIAGLIAIVVEATSMGAGSFLSESSADEFENKKSRSPVIDGIIMFFAYFIFGFVPLTPYIVLELHQARYVSIFVTLITLFALGYTPKKSAKSGLKMAIVAGIAASIGYGVAHIFSV